MNVQPALAADLAACARRMRQHSLVRIAAATAWLLLPVALLRHGLAAQFSSAAIHPFWPSLLSMVSAGILYLAYARTVERRAPAELSLLEGWREAGSGLTAGAALFGLALGTLSMSGAYDMTAVSPWASVTAALCSALLAGFLSELVIRGTVFRIAEESMGTHAALLLSLALCVSVRIASGDCTLAGLLSAIIEGLLLGVAYISTRRLWLGIGIHAGWSIAQGGVFALPLSGTAGEGLIQGTLAGPAWLTGGSAGIANSLPGLVALLVGALLMLSSITRQNLR